MLCFTQLFIGVGYEAARLNNFHTAFYIMAALTMHPVYRLKDLRNVLEQKSLEQLKKMTSPRSVPLPSAACHPLCRLDFR